MTPFWTFLKKYWQTILLVLVIIFAGLWIKHVQSNFSKALSDLNGTKQNHVT